MKVDRVPADVRDKPEPEGREREPSTLDELPGDQADENRRAERGNTGDPLQEQVAQTSPPPREGTAGYVSGRIERAHDPEDSLLARSYEWIFLIDFLSNFTTAAGSGEKNSFGPNF